MAVANLVIRISAQLSELQRDMTQAKNTVQGFERNFTVAATKASFAGNLMAQAMARLPSVVIGAMRGVTEMGSRLDDLSQQTGLTTDQLQRLEFAAGHAGVTLEQITDAIGQMQRRLGSGESAEAIHRLGLNVQQLRQMQPGEMFLAMADALRKVENQTTLAYLAQEVFGRSGTQLIPALRENMRELGQQATVVSAETIKLAADFDDLWFRATQHGKALVAEAFGPLLTALAGTDAAVVKLTQSWLPLNRALGAFGVGIRVAQEQAQRLANVAGFSWADVFGQRLNTPATPAAPPTRPGAISGEPLSAKAIKSLEDESHRFFAKTKDGWTKAQSAADEYRESLRRLTVTLSGSETLRQADLHVAAIARMGGTATLTRDKMDSVNKVMSEALVIYTAQGRVAPKAIRDTYFATINLADVIDDLSDGVRVVDGLTSEFEALGRVKLPDIFRPAEHLPATIDGLKNLGDVGRVFIQMPLAPKTIQWGDALSDAARSLDDLATLSGPTFGGILRGLSQIVTAADAMRVRFDALRRGGGILGMLTGGLGLFTGGLSIVQTIAGLAGLLDRNKGRDMVKDFAAGFGGFEALHAKLLELGDAGEQMWVRLTQGVGRNNMDQARTAIDEITGALTEQNTQADRLNAAMQEYGFTWQDMGEKMRGQRLAELFTDLFDKTKLLQGAGIDYNEILRRQSDQYSELVQSAIRTGTEIPASMRRTLEDLLAMGELVDENGQAFMDLSRVQWAETLTQGFDRVVLKLDEMIDRITGAGSALDSLGRRRVTIPIGVDTSALDRFGGGKSQNITVQVGEDVIARAAVRGMPSEIRLHGGV